MRLTGLVKLAHQVFLKVSSVREIHCLEHIPSLRIVSIEKINAVLYSSDYILYFSSETAVFIGLGREWRGSRELLCLGGRKIGIPLIGLFDPRFEPADCLLVQLDYRSRSLRVYD